MSIVIVEDANGTPQGGAVSDEVANEVAEIIADGAVAEIAAAPDAMVQIAEIEANRDIVLAEINAETQQADIGLSHDRIESNAGFEQCQTELSELREQFSALLTRMDTWTPPILAVVEEVTPAETASLPLSPLEPASAAPIPVSPEAEVAPVPEPVRARKALRLI